MPKAIDIRKYNGIRLGLIGARKNMTLSQQELANKAFIARSIIAELERGKRDTSSNNWKKLKEVLMVGSVEELWEQYDYKDNRWVGTEGTIIKDTSIKAEEHEVTH